MISLWFPKAIFFQPNILNHKLESYEEEIRNALTEVGVSRDPLKNVSSTHKTRDNLFEVANLDGLRKAFFDQSRLFLDQIGYKNLDSLHFTNVWANVSYEGDYIFPHNHNGSLISGVYYIKSDINECIKFFNTPSMLPDPDVWNENNHQFCQYQCIPGSLILFPSDLMHGVEKQHAAEKISISFNMSL